MSYYKTSLKWNRTTPDFQHGSFNRNHKIRFGCGEEIEASSAPDFIGDPNKSNPEELFVAALSSCHMLTFLALAAKMRFTVDEYIDHAKGELAKNEDGRMAMTQVTLHPKVVFSGEKQPDQEKIESIHEKAHRYCFIANSVKCPVLVKPA